VNVQSELERQNCTFQTRPNGVESNECRFVDVISSNVQCVMFFYYCHQVLPHTQAHSHKQTKRNHHTVLREETHFLGPKIYMIEQP